MALAFCGASAPTKAAAAALFFQIVGGGLHGRLAGVAELVCGMPLREVNGGANDDILWVDVVHKGVDRLREVISGANADIRS
jgi:hypothetical protein